MKMVRIYWNNHNILNDPLLAKLGAPKGVKINSNAWCFFFFAEPLIGVTCATEMVVSSF